MDRRNDFAAAREVVDSLKGPFLVLCAASLIACAGDLESGIGATGGQPPVTTTGGSAGAAGFPASGGTSLGAMGGAAPGGAGTGPEGGGGGGGIPEGGGPSGGAGTGNAGNAGNAGSGGGGVSGAGGMVTGCKTGGGADDVAAPGLVTVAYYGHFSELPVGAVTPLGWVRAWLGRQESGLTGHPENLAYPYDTIMYAGRIPAPAVSHGQDWWRYEQAGYFVDAAVRLSGLIGSPNARRISDANLSYIVDHSGAAKIGESTFAWPNAVVGRALMAGYGATGDADIAHVLHTAIGGHRGIAGRDGYVFEEALYLYGLTGDTRLLDFAKTAYDSYFIDDTASFSHRDRIRGTGQIVTHGVTAAEQLKLLPLMYSYTGDAEALELSELALRKVEANSLMPDGGMVSSENLGTTAFNSLHESCDITDWSWTIGYALMASGNAHWGDLIEQTTFNALPGAVTKDFKQLQYFSSANQIAATNGICPRIARTRMSYRAAHDTECCAGNVNRAMPNYVTRMWMGMPGGLAATLYGPSEVKAVVKQSCVTVTEETDYPFRDTITFTIRIGAPLTFALGLRIPAWANGASATVNGTASGIAMTAGSFAVLEREYHDGDRVVLKLPMAVTLKDWLGARGVSVQRGPLVFSLKLDETRVESTRDDSSTQSVLKGNNIQGFPAVQFTPAGEWRYGMAAAQKNAPQTFTVVEAPMTDNPFQADTAPVRIQLPLRPLPQWLASWRADTATENPTSLPTSAELQSVGAAQTMTLLPYGSTHLRLTMLPVVN